MEHEITFGVTAFGSPEVIQQYDDDLRLYEPVFTDRGMNVNMLKEDWL